MKKACILIYLTTFIGLNTWAQIATKNNLSLFNTKFISNTVNQRVNSTQFKPSKELVSNWDVPSGLWIYSDSIRNTYNSVGNITQRLLYPYFSINLDKSTYSYNLNNKITIDSNLIWNGSTYVPNSIHTFTYDINGNKTQEIIYNNWSGSVWLSGSKVNLTYDVNNNQTQYITQNWSGGVWVNSYKSDCTWSGGIAINSIEQTWNVNTWDNSAKQDFIHTSGQLSALTLSLWNGTNWVVTSKLNNILWQQWSGMFNENSKVSGYTEQVPNGGLWKDTIKTTISFDSFGNQTDYLVQSKPNTIYITTDEIKNNYQYNGNNSITEDIQQNWNTTLQNTENWKKREFFDFLQFTSSTCLPNQPSTIIGNTTVNVSAVQTYSVINDVNATSYIWSLPVGYSGSSTTNTISITVGNTNGIISVVAQNSCGISSARSLNITVSNSGTVTPGINFDWVWAKSTNDENAGVYLHDMATDNLGNTYITGFFSSSTIKFGSITLNKISTGSNMFIAKYDATGNALWAKNANLGGIGSSEYAVITDANNDVYISGAYKNSLTFDGVPLSNPTGNSGTAMYLIKLNTTGNLIWAQDVNYSNDITVTGMSVDSQNNIFIAGDYSAADINFGGTVLTYYSNNNPFIVKYNALGNVVWAKGTSQNNFGGIANFCYDVATDLNGNSYITGNYMGNANATLTFGSVSLPLTNGGRNFYLTKYNNLGDVEWVQTSTGNSPSNGGREDIGRSIATDLNGNIIVTGSFESATINFGGISLVNYTSNNFQDIFVVKYNSLGTALWAKKAGGTNQEEGTGIAVDGNNAIYVSGYFNSKPVTFGSFIVNQIGSAPLNFVAKYDDLGNEVFVKHIEKTYSYSAAYPACVSCDINGNVFLSGKAYDDATFGSITLLSGGIYIAKLGDTQVGIHEETNSKESFVIYPNPSTGIFQIKHSELQKNVSMSIFNMHGQTVFELNQFVAEINLSNKPKGIYFLQIKSEDGITNKKIILQ